MVRGSLSNLQPFTRDLSPDFFVKPPKHSNSPHPHQSIANIIPANMAQFPYAICYSKIRSQRWRSSARPRQNRADACRPTGPEGDHAGHLKRRLPHTASSHTGLVALSERTRSGSDSLHIAFRSDEY